MPLDPNNLPIYNKILLSLVSMKIKFLIKNSYEFTYS